MLKVTMSPPVAPTYIIEGLTLEQMQKLGALLCIVDDDTFQPLLTAVAKNANHMRYRTKLVKTTYGNGDTRYISVNSLKFTSWA